MDGQPQIKINRGRDKASDCQSFSESDLRSDPDGIFDAASQHGCAVVVGDDGAPTVIISVQKEELPEFE